jgi:hypothetical protein
MSERYVCCFCGLTIEPVGPDIGSLLYTTNWDQPREVQHDQGLFCHASCLQGRMHPSVKLYVLSLTTKPEDSDISQAKLPDWLR